MEAILFYFIPIFAGIAFLASLTIYLRRPIALYLRLLSFYLLYDCINESYTNYLAYHIRNTILLSSLSTIFAFCFFLYLVRAVIRGPKAKRILLYCLLAFPLISVGNILLVQKPEVFQTMTYSLGCLLVVAACIYYFLELFRSRSYVNLLREPAFWICSGLLFYSACTFPVYGLINFIHFEFAVIRVILYILDFINILLYLSFTIAFLCRLRTRKSL
jgi:hypothetical protein